MKKLVLLFALWCGPTFGQSAPVLVTFEGTPANTQPSQAQLNAGVLGTTGGGAFNSGAPSGFTVVVATDSPSFPGSTSIGGTGQLGNGTHVLQWSTSSTPTSFQYIFRAGSKANASFGVFFCADFDLSVVGGQYSNNSITANGGSTQNILLGPNPSPGGLSLETNGSFSTGAVLAYHGGNCLTDPTNAAWRWITLGYAQSGSNLNRMNVYDAGVTTLLGSWHGPTTGTALNPGSAQFGMTGGETETAGHHLYWKNEMIDDVTGTFPLLPATTPTVATPTFSPVAGTYALGQSVTISTVTAGATICFTTDGSTPTANGAGTCTHGTTYSTSVNVSTTQTVKAIGSLSGSSDSAVGSALYTINATLWTGIIAAPRATDWTTAGVVGGIPSASYTQCGSTIAAGASAATITAQLATCGANQYVLLGPGVFNITTTITFPQKSNLVLRGSGANSTFITVTSALNNSSIISMTASSGTTSPVEWTAGYAQGSNQITVSSVAGVVAGQTVAILDQCEDGFTGDTCAGASVDNGNFYNCSVKYAAPNNCSTDGPDGTQLFRWQQERSLVTNVSGNVLTLQDTLRHPNWASGQTPHASFNIPLQFVGLENLSIDSTGATTDVNHSPSTIALGHLTNSWVQGVRIVNSEEHAIGDSFGSHNTIRQNYMAGSSTSPSHCIASAQVAKNLVESNICVGFSPGIHTEQSNDSSVESYNYVLTGNSSAYMNDSMGEPFRNHSNGVAYMLREGNVASLARDDITHGTIPFQTYYRNFLTGWESCANGLCGGSGAKDFETNARIRDAFDRYHQDIANVWGTLGYHTVYKSTGSPANATFLNGEPNGSVPSDPLVSTSGMQWGNYDTVTAAVRWCGNSSDTGWSTTCASTSEVPTGAAVYPNPVPTLGDTGAGQSAMPASFYLSARPTWWVGSIPFPAVGPDVSSGSVGQCSGSLNVAGQFNALAAITNAQCGNHGITASAWGGHVNAIPAMACYLNIMGGVPDGSNSPLAFNPAACYPVSGGTVSISPTSEAFGSLAVGSTSAAQVSTFTNNIGTTITITGVSFTSTGSSPGTNYLNSVNNCSGTLATGNSCTISTEFKPTATGSLTDTLSVAYTGVAGSPQTVSLSGTGINPTAATPSCAPASGTYGATQSVTCSVAGGAPVLCYTTNGTTPATNGTSGCTTGTHYTGAISIAASSTLTVIAGGTGFNDGSAISYSFVINATPTGAPSAKALIAKNLAACPVCSAVMQPCLCFTQDQNIYLSTGAAYSLFATFAPPVTSVNGHTGAVILKPTATVTIP